MPLSTQLDLEKFLQVSFTVNPDPVVDLLLDYAEAIIEAETGRTFAAETSIVETLDGRGDRILFLSKWPVSAVNSLTEDGAALVDGTDFYWYPDGRLVRGAPTSPWELSWSLARQNVLVDYDAGYSTIPTDLASVSTRIVARIFQASAAYANAPVGADGVKRISLEGSDTIEFTEAVADVTAGVRDLVELDRRVLSRYMRYLP